MPRPKRLYKTKTGRSYYLVKGKRKYLKKDVIVPKKGGITVNIRNIIQKKPTKRAPRKKTAFALNPQTAGLPVHLAVEQKPITQIEDIVKGQVKQKEKEKEKKEKETAIVPFQKSKDFKDIEERLRLIEKKKDESDEEFIKKVGKSAVRRTLENIERTSRRKKREEEGALKPSERVEEVKEEALPKRIKPKPEIPKKYASVKPASVNANKNVRYNIDTLFMDFIAKYGDENGDYARAWRKFQQSSAYFNPVADSDELYKSQPPFVYNYVPKFKKIKSYEGESSAYETGDKKKRDIAKEKEEETSPYTESEAEKKKVKERTKAKPKVKGSPKKITHPDLSSEHEYAKVSENEKMMPRLLRKELKESQIPPSEGDESDRSLTEGRGASGLYNHDIEDIMKGLKHGPCPVITSDKISMLPSYVSKGMKKFGAIINTNPSTSDGSGTDGYRVGHWRAVFFDNDEDGRVSAEFFDPLCEGTIPPTLKKIMTKVAEKMNPEDYALIKENHLKRQSDQSNTCGYFCIKFIDDRYNDVPWSEATGYDEWMKKHKPDDSVEGEKSLVKPIKKYDKYI